MQDMIRKNRTQIRTNDIEIKNFQNKVYQVVQFIDDFDELRKMVHKNLFEIIKKSEMRNVDIDPDIKKEYENQRRYLENSKNSLKKRLEKEQQIHKEDNMNIMRDNINLIAMISEWRNKVKKLKTEEKNRRTQLKMRANQSQMIENSKRSDADFSTSMGMERQRMLQERENKRQYIEDL